MSTTRNGLALNEIDDDPLLESREPWGIVGEQFGERWDAEGNSSENCATLQFGELWDAPAEFPYEAPPRPANSDE